MTELYWLTGAQLRRISNVLRQANHLKTWPLWDIEETGKVSRLPQQIWYEQCIGDVDDLERLLERASEEEGYTTAYCTPATGTTAKDTQPPRVPAGLAPIVEKRVRIRVSTRGRPNW